MFENCVNLENLTIPDSVHRFGSYMLNGVEKLENLNIPKNLDSADISSLGYSGLKSLTINHDLNNIEGLSVIDGVHFKNLGLGIVSLSNISKLIISNKVQHIEPMLFKDDGK